MNDRNIEFSGNIVKKYLDRMINQFYKILPLKENKESSLNRYMESLQREMLGCKELVKQIGEDGAYLSLLSILQYLIDNDCEVKVVRSEVFKAIRLCENLKNRYEDKEE